MHLDALFRSPQASTSGIDESYIDAPGSSSSVPSGLEYKNVIYVRNEKTWP